MIRLAVSVSITKVTSVHYSAKSQALFPILTMSLPLFYLRYRSCQRPQTLLPRRQQHLRCQPPFQFPALSLCRVSCPFLPHRLHRLLLLHQRLHRPLLYHRVLELLVKHTRILMEPITLSLVISTSKAVIFPAPTVLLLFWVACLAVMSQQAVLVWSTTQ